MKKHDKHMYDLSANQYCGVYMEDSVMRQFVKITDEYQRNIKKMLNANREKLMVSHWTMASSDNKKPVYVKFTKLDQGELGRRISLFKVKQPECIKDLYIVESYDEAEEIAEKLLNEQL